MSLTRVAPSLIAVANNVTSNVFGSANTIPSFTFDASGVITAASNTALQINTADIVANAITTTKIAAGAITNDKVALTGNLVISGATSGSTTIQATDGATQTITLPNNTGTVITTATGQTLTSPVIAGTPTGVGVLTSGTSVASTSGTSITFTDIPSWAKRITLMFSQVSTNGASNPLMQLGTSSGITTSGYTAGATYLGPTNGIDTYTAGFGFNTASSTNSFHGSLVFSLLNSSTNIWVLSGVIYMTGSSNFTYQMSGRVALSATLDRVRVTTVNGTDTFDAGSINILFE
jgi:hypothetical protein